MILHLLRMRRNVNRNVFNDRKNVTPTRELCCISASVSNKRNSALSLIGTRPPFAGLMTHCGSGVYLGDDATENAVEFASS